MNVLQDIFLGQAYPGYGSCNYCTEAWAPVVPDLLKRPTIKLHKTVIHRKSKKSKSGLGFCFGCFFL